ncbi:MAG: hypothetical protein IMZ66_05935 [Planctomycetes bacterium]|nr:hypothetical protein [Planctomycetota bacterium]
MAQDVKKVAEGGFEKLVAEALGCLEGELEQYEQQAFYVDPGSARVGDFGEAVEAARRFGYLEAVCAVLDRAVDGPPKPSHDPPAGPSHAPGASHARATELLTQARRLSPKAGAEDPVGLAVWLLDLRAAPAARAEPATRPEP